MSIGKYVKEERCEIHQVICISKFTLLQNYLIFLQIIAPFSVLYAVWFAVLHFKIFLDSMTALAVKSIYIKSVSYGIESPRCVLVIYTRQTNCDKGWGELLNKIASFTSLSCPLLKRVEVTPERPYIHLFQNLS